MRVKELFPSALLFQGITHLSCRNESLRLSRGAVRGAAPLAPALFWWLNAI
jgi:hypothetical protein